MNLYDALPRAGAVSLALIGGAAFAQPQAQLDPAQRPRVEISMTARVTGIATEAPKRIAPDSPGFNVNGAACADLPRLQPELFNAAAA